MLNNRADRLCRQGENTGVQISKGRLLSVGPAKRYVTGVNIAATGEIYLSVRRPVSVGEILTKRIRHSSDPARGFVAEGESVINYKVLDCVDASVVREAVRRTGKLKSFRLAPNRVWVSVHGD